MHTYVYICICMRACVSVHLSERARVCVHLHACHNVCVHKDLLWCGVHTDASALL